MKDGRFESPKEVMQALIDGKKIRAEYFAGTAYLFLNEKGIHYHLGTEDSKYHLSFADPEKWFIHEEPKQKVRLYKYIYKDDEMQDWYESSKYYKNDEHFKEDFCSDYIYFKNLSSVIEVEE